MFASVSGEGRAGRACYQLRRKNSPAYGMSFAAPVVSWHGSHNEIHGMQKGGPLKN